MNSALRPGERFPDIELADHAGNLRRLSDLVGGDPALLNFFRGRHELDVVCRGAGRRGARRVRGGSGLVAGRHAGGVLAAWPAAFRPKVPAVKIDARIVDRDGAGAEVSLALAPPGVRLLFDDTAVQQARRDVIAGRPPRALSTLLRGDSIFAGAVTVDPAGDDPFARIFPARRLRVGPGLFGRVAAHPGPDIERHGSGAPWPYPMFDTPHAGRFAVS